MPRAIMLVVLLPAALLSGCVVKTVVSAASAPLRIAGKAADLATTSQSEADENRGRAMRHNDENLRKLQKAYRKALVNCNKGRGADCADAERISEQITKIQAR